jgi:hypothetical protein
MILFLTIFFAVLAAIVAALAGVLLCGWLLMVQDRERGTRL